MAPAQRFVQGARRLQCHAEPRDIRGRRDRGFRRQVQGAVAYAAGQLGHRARIFVPAASPPVKIDQIRSFGAEAVVDARTYAEALAHALSYEQQSGSLNIHAYDQPSIIHGQATLGLEWAVQSQLDSGLVAWAAAV
jgi:threonine dehydratase